MSEITENPPLTSPPRRRRPLLPHIDWRPRLRWFAAEYLIVVTGVLTAVAIDAWWDGRQEAAREAQALERLHEESEAVVRYLQHDIAAKDSTIRAQEAAVAALTPGATVEPDPETFREGVFMAFFFTPVNPPRSVYDEVIATGAFGDLSSVEVRSAISKYYARLDDVQNRLTVFRQVAQQGQEMMTSTYAFAYDPESPQRMRVMVERATLRGDPRAYSLLAFGLRNQIVFQIWRRRVYADAVTMCETLAEAVGKACEAVREGEGGTDGSPPG